MCRSSPLSAVAAPPPSWHCTAATPARSSCPASPGRSARCCRVALWTSRRRGNLGIALRRIDQICGPRLRARECRHHALPRTSAACARAGVWPAHSADLQGRRAGARQQPRRRARPGRHPLLARGVRGRAGVRSIGCGGADMWSSKKSAAAAHDVFRRARARAHEVGLDLHDDGRCTATRMFALETDLSARPEHGKFDSWGQKPGARARRRARSSRRSAPETDAPCSIFACKAESVCIGIENAADLSSGRALHA